MKEKSLGPDGSYTDGIGKIPGIVEKKGAR